MPSIVYPGGLAATACVVVVATLTALSAPALSNNASDRTIVPGVRVGAIYGLSTPTQLRRVYGRNLVMKKVYEGEGFYADGAVIFAGTPSEVRLFWRKGRQGVRRIIVQQRSSRWRTRSGVRIGASIPRVVQLNRKHFRVQRENDGHNCNSQWQGGRLSKNLLICFREARKLSNAQSNRISRHEGMHTRLKIVQQVFVSKSFTVFLNKTRPPKKAADAQGDARQASGGRSLTFAQRRCALRQNLVSPKGGVVGTITFINRSGAYRSIMWLDFRGQPKTYANLNNGQRFTAKTAARHAWMVTDGPGNCLEIHLAHRGRKTVVLRLDKRTFGPE